MKANTFDLSKACADAWELLWKDKVAEQGDASHYRECSTHYLTASDIANQIRQFAQEQADGKPRGSYGRAYYGGHSVRLNCDVMGVARLWLRAQVRDGILESHNFGRGHISGERFRPAGLGLTAAEKATLARRERARTRPRPKHFRPGAYGTAILCARRGRYSTGHYRHQPLGTQDWSEVTCPRCLKKREPIDAR